jgi:hypothetical protein
LPLLVLLPLLPVPLLLPALPLPVPLPAPLLLPAPAPLLLLPLFRYKACPLPHLPPMPVVGLAVGGLRRELLSS